MINLDSPAEKEQVLSNRPDPDTTGTTGTTEYQIQQYINSVRAN